MSEQGGGEADEGVAQGEAGVINQGEEEGTILPEGGAFVGDKVGGVPESCIFELWVIKQLHKECVWVEPLPTGIYHGQAVNLEEGQGWPVNEFKVLCSITEEYDGLENEVPFMSGRGLLCVDEEISVGGPESHLEQQQVLWGFVLVEDTSFSDVSELEHGGLEASGFNMFRSAGWSN